MPKRKRRKAVRGSHQPLPKPDQSLLRPKSEAKPANVIRVCRIKGEYHYEGQAIAHSFQCYVFYLNRKAVRGKGRDWVKADQKCVSTDWHRIAPVDCHLKPGEGPIRVKIERVK